MIRYLGVVTSVSLGMYIHVILFNLYLADLGLKEDAMGRYAAAMTLGTITGALPSAALASRWGLRRVIQLALAVLAVALAARVSFTSPLIIAAASFASGVAMAAYVATNAPAIAALASERHRAAAFSGNLAVSIGLGTLGGFLGGGLPRLLGGKQAALWFAAAVPLAGYLFLWRLRLDGAVASRMALCGESKAFLGKFFPAVALWYAFAAGFSPYFNIYFSRLGASTEAIGFVFGATKVVQTFTVLAMSRCITRWGLTPAVAGVQLASAGILMAFLPVHSFAPAAILYAAFSAAEIMAAPGLQQMLMERVRPEERPTAAACNELAVLLVHAAVAWGVGWLVAARGYQPLFVILALTGVAAASLFAATFGRRTTPP